MDLDSQPETRDMAAPLGPAEPAFPQPAPSADGSEPPPLWAELDQVYRAAVGRLTMGSSPLALPLAVADWFSHMAHSPFRCAYLATEGSLNWLKMGAVALGGRVIEPAPDDHRFTGEGWRSPPYSFYEQGFLLAEDLAQRATTGVSGVTRENERLVSFTARQALDAVSPSNLPWTNPEAIEATRRTGGDNLVQGAGNWLKDLGDLVDGRPADKTELRVGRDLAVTPGMVVFRNDLIELIQYAPQTETVRPEPILIVPAWIMKYYILDLSPHNSLIRFLAQQGYTVFCISWRNPGPQMRDVGLDDYRRAGVLAALDAISAICPDVKIHTCGYCLGGTLLSLTAAAMARDADARLASATLLCAQTDFTEAGELQLFTTEDQVSFLEDVMAAQGYLDGRQMGGAFELLRSRDLIWSRLAKSYWLGEREHPNDLMTWNADATRMPARMHTEYLRRMFLRNDLAEGRLEVDGRPISIGDIEVPLFVVSTEGDHVAPWRSVHKIHLLNPHEVTFVLASGGHNAGIVSEPGHPRRSFRIRTRPPGGRYPGPDEWIAGASRHEGSWWLAWTDWLQTRSGPQDQPPPSMGAPELGFAPLEPAPGQYVFER
jgi:polyhydroxyalkanoate synthase